jgi:glycosyltransferase involved in cell wall biosynthesis
VLDLVGIVEALNQTDISPTLEIQLHIAGDGDQREILEQQLDEVKGRVQVIFHGSIPREKLYQIYNKAHVLLLMSSSEGLSMALREAMLHGAVPVVTDIPVNREIVEPGKNGFLFPVGDVRACASMCAKVALSDDYQQMSVAARQCMQGHSTEESARKYAALIRQLAEGPLS